MECSECEADIRHGHLPGCSRYRRMVCRCGHLSEQHDEEGECQVCSCNCVLFEAKEGE